MEDATLRGTIHTHADAIAKLRAVAKWLERGERKDGADELALADAIRWLEVL